MNIIAAIRQEERKLEKELSKLRRKLEGVRAAGKALGGSAGRELRTVKKRVLSEVGKANIIRAAKKRWAKIRAEGKTLGGSAKREVTTMKKRVLSEAGKRNIARAAKKRWAKFRAETGGVGNFPSREKYSGVRGPLCRTVCGAKVYGRCGDMVQGLARGPLKAEIRVRIPVSLPKPCQMLQNRGV
jgi:hypothetical protein